MKFRLGLDIGVGSIGGAILCLNEENQVTDIKDAGVSVFEVSEGAVERREKRHQRRNIKRRRQRLDLLSSELEKIGLWTFEQVKQDKLIKLSPYAIRAQAVNGKLNDIMELGRAILHLAKHRGASFVSIQQVELENKEQEEEENKPKNKSKVSDYAKLPEHLKESDAKTIGEYFYMRLHSSYKHKNLINDTNKRYVRQRQKAAGKLVDYAIPRYLVKEEFNKIWDKQALYYPKLRDEDLKKKIFDILFFEKHHRPYATGKCIFLSGESRLPKAHPLSEYRRIYEAANNIRLKERSVKRKLELPERDKIINEILLKDQL